LKATLLAAVSLILFTALSSNAAGLNDRGASSSDIDGLQFKILSADGKATIGYTRFTVLRNNSTEEIKGETRYLDGERDSEDEVLSVAPQTYALCLETYEHSFFNTDGTLQMVDKLDAKSGVASCASYASGKMKLRRSQLDVPADSFAGASGLMMLVGSLRRGTSPLAPLASPSGEGKQTLARNREIKFHAFACAPGPEIFSVKALLPDRSDHWSLYPGDLVRLDMRPDLGALNLLIAPFLPTMDAWFNPADNWSYVGGEFDRYFRGPHVLTVRVPPALN
jgi:hypothetical protein